MADIGRLVASIRLDNKMLRADVAKAQGQFQALGTTVGTSVNHMRASLLSLNGAIAGIGVGMLAVQIAKMGMEFEQTMRTVQGVMRATEDQYQNLTAAARHMGETTEWSATQAADALRFLGMAGMGVDKAIAALPRMLDLATAGAIDLGRAADISTNVLTAMGLEVDQLAAANDVLTATFTNSNTDLNMLAESFKYAAPAANAFGYSIQELSAMIGALGNAGIQGSTAGTNLQQAFVRANKAAQDLGIKSSHLIDVIRAMKEQQWNANQVYDAFGRIAGKSVLALIDNIEGYEELYNKTKEATGVTKALADIMRGTTKGAFLELKSVIQSVGLDVFGEEAKDLKDVFKELAEWIRANRKDIVDFAGDVATIGKHIAWVFATVIGGWSRLPVIIQEMGLISALVLGVKGRLVLVAIGAVIAGIKKLKDELFPDSNPQRANKEAILTQTENRLEQLKAQLNSPAMQLRIKTMPNHPALIELKKQISHEKARILDLQQWLHDNALTVEDDTADKEGIDKPLSEPGKDFAVFASGEDEAQNALASRKKMLAEWVDFVKKAKLTEVEYAKWALKKELDGVLASNEYQKASQNERLQMLDTFNAYQIAKIAETEKRIASEKQRALDSWNSKYVSAMQGDAAAQVLEINKQAEAFRAEHKENADVLVQIAQWREHEITKIMEKAEANRLASSKKGIDGAKRALKQYVDEVSDNASHMANLVQDTFRGMENSFVSFATTGKFEFKGMVDSIIADLARIAAQKMVIRPLAEFLLGGGVGGGGGILSDIGGLFGFANGGSFDVGAATSVGRISGIDNRLVAFRARDGEHVTVDRPGQSRDVPISQQTVTVNIKDEKGKQVVPSQTFNSSGTRQFILDVVYDGWARNEQGRWRT